MDDMNEEFDVDGGEDNAPDTQDADVQPQKRPKSGRAEARIRSLVAERNAFRERAEAAEAKAKKLEVSATTVQSKQVEDGLRAASAEVEAAEEELAAASEDGDGKRIARASRRLVKAETAVAQYEAWKNYYSQQEPVEDEPQKGKSVDRPAQPALGPREKRWMASNPWYGDRSDPTHVIMAYTVNGIHDTLVSEGYNPADPDDPDFGADAYWDQIDTRLKERFPDKLGGKKDDPSKPAAKKTAPPVSEPAPGRAGERSKKTVRLTEDHRLMAKKLGIPEEKYAEQLAKTAARKRGGEVPV